MSKVKITTSITDKMTVTRQSIINQTTVTDDTLAHVTRGLLAEMCGS